MSMINVSKKRKAPAFSVQEDDRLLSLVEENYAVLCGTDQKADANKRRNNAWISVSFMRNEVFTRRTMIDE
jgi:hypothetical protein